MFTAGWRFWCDTGQLSGRPAATLQYLRDRRRAAGSVAGTASLDLEGWRALLVGQQILMKLAWLT